MVICQNAEGVHGEQKVGNTCPGRSVAAETTLRFTENCLHKSFTYPVAFKSGIRL